MSNVRIAEPYKILQGIGSDQRLVQRFWAKVSRSEGCWLWRASLSRSGYGQFAVHRRPVPAHRVASALTHGAIPENLLICHTCDNPVCVRPGHLFAGTHQDNSRDAVAKGRQSIPPRYGEAHPRAKLTAVAARAIVAYRQSGVSEASLAARYEVSRRTIYSVVKGEYWSSATEGLR